MRIGSLVLGNTYRHPAVVAKTAAAIDEICQGRFVLGIGAGWQVNEHAAYGIELGSVRDRLVWFAEACEVITRLRSGEPVTYDGTRYQLRDASLSPGPVGPLPLLIGASGERTMPRIVAAYADEWNTWATPDVFAHKSAIMNAACEARDRDPATLRRTAQALIFIGDDGAERASAAGRAAIGGTPQQLTDILGEYRDAGVDEFVVSTFGKGNAAQIDEFADQIWTEIGAPLRD